MIISDDNDTPDAINAAYDLRYSLHNAKYMIL